MSVLEQGQIQIHTENIFPIIKKAVYSSRKVFLGNSSLCNGTDAISKRRMAAMAGDCVEGDEGRINITVDREAKTLTISDNGIGMTADEVKRTSTRLPSPVQRTLEIQARVRRDHWSFRIEFYSRFMVAKEVELITRSARPDESAVRWVCDGSPAFKLETMNARNQAQM